MTTLLLNIGLANEDGSLVYDRTALQSLAFNGFLAYRHGFIQSDTERTLVAEVSYFGDDPLADALMTISEELGQDCLAAFDPATRQGSLIGPRADNWGEFSPEFFFTLDGRRLSEIQP